MTIQTVRQHARQLTSFLTLLAVSFTFVGCDSEEGWGEFESNLNAAADSFSGTEDTMLSGNLAFNDWGADRTYAVESPPANGTATVESTGSFTYMPNPDFFGDDSFTVLVTDRTGATASSTVTISIENVFDTIEEYGWTLVWSDEFDGDTLNAANWTPQLGDGSDVGLTRWGNNELQWYQSENITVADGNLKITARAEEVVASFPYTSGRMRSIDNVDIKYGRIEARVQPPAGQGLWSAFWMLPTDSPYTGWAASGEIDIMEVVNAGIRDEAFGTLHHGFPWPLNQLSTKTVAMTPEDGFHTYAIEWEENEIRWYIDDVHYHTVRSDHWRTYYYGGQDTGYVEGQGGAPFDVDFHILLNLAVGGNLPGSPNASTVFPAELLVDYVRVYECSNDPVTGTGCASWVDDAVTAPAAQDVFIETVDLYTDAAGPLSWTIAGEEVTRDLAVVSFWDNGGALLLSEVAAADPARGMVIDVNTTNSGNFQIWAPDGEGIDLFGMGNNPNFWELHAAELKFDLYIDSAGTDLASSLLVKMDSGWPALGFVTLAVADLPQDEWTTVSVKVNDLLANSGDQPLDTSNVNAVFVLEPTGMAHVQVDNIQLVCGHPANNGCGVRPPSVEVSGDVINVFIDEVDATWTNGIGAWDTAAGTDYFVGNSGNHVSWSLVDTGEAGHDTVIEVDFAADGANGVFFIQAASGVDLTSLAGGNLVFDLRLPAGATHGITYKVDCTDPCGTGDQPLTGVVPGDWQTFEIPIDSLVAAGLELDKVNSPIVIFPTWDQQQGVSFELDNVRYEIGDGSGGGGQTQVDLPVTFDDADVDYDLGDFGVPVSAMTTLVDDPTDAGNMVASSVKPLGAPTWAGTTVGATNGLATAIPFTATETTMTVRVYSPDSGIPVLLKVEDKTDPTRSVETEALTTGVNTWETLTFDFSNEAPDTAALDLSYTYDKVSIFFNFGTDGDTAGEKTYLWDDIAWAP